MTKLEIRKAKKADASAILTYLNQIGGESDNLLFSKGGFSHITTQQEEELIQELHNSSNSTILLGIQDNQILSVATLKGASRERIAHRSSLALSVRRSHWNQGIASQMLNSLIAFAKEQHIDILELDVRADNLAALHLYQKVGFEEIGRHPYFLKIDHQYYPVILMTLSL